MKVIFGPVPDMPQFRVRLDEVILICLASWLELRFISGLGLRSQKLRNFMKYLLVLSIGNVGICYMGIIFPYSVFITRRICR